MDDLVVRVTETVSVMIAPIQDGRPSTRELQESSTAVPATSGPRDTPAGAPRVGPLASTGNSSLRPYRNG